jgi:hypothetical protein
MRFVLTTRIQNHCFDIIEDIIELIYSKEKKAYFKKINLHLEKLRILMRIAYDKAYLSHEQMERVVIEINTTGKMLGGWEKSDANN